MKQNFNLKLITLAVLVLTALVLLVLYNKVSMEKTTTPNISITEGNNMNNVQELIENKYGQFKIYPNNIVSVDSNDGQDGFSISLTTTDDISKVTNWQMEELEETGWNILSMDTEESDYQTFTAIKDNHKLEYESQSEDDTSIMRIFISSNDENK